MEDREENKRNVIGLLVKSFIFLAALCICITLLPGKLAAETIREGGVVETISAYGYFLFCIFLFHFRREKIYTDSIAPAIFLLLLGLRELDFHARFTSMGIFKSRFYISPEVPLQEKLIAVLLVVAILVYGIRYIRSTLSGFVLYLRRWEPFAWATAAGIFLIVSSKFIDSNDEILIFLFSTMDNPKVVVRTIEECMELCIPFFFILGLIEYCKLQLGQRERERNRAGG